MPQRRDLNLDALAPMLGLFSMIEVIDGGADFLVRVFGTSLAEVSGVEITGRSVRAMPEPRSVAINLTLFNRVVETHQPLRVWRPRFLHGPQRVDRRHSEVCLILPFSENGTRVDRLLTHSDLLVEPVPNDAVIDLPITRAP
ncbi:MAG: hypothetical protein EAZ99_03435 [Alphaproteobacteria bacterium]|nr:MAG: hypothetical protein EAZ99_03435 [Alphaproteobacteria bacterium]